MSSLTTIRRMAIVDDGARKRGDGLKGQFFDVTLGGVDVFVGPNDSGKSTRMLTPYVVALGLASTPSMNTSDNRLPYLGALPERTSGVLYLDTADGPREIRRDLSTGSTSKANRQTALDVAEAMGAPPVRWDLRDFAGGTDSDRAKIVDAVVRTCGDAGGWTVQRVLSELPDSELAVQLATTIDTSLEVSDWLARATEWAGAGGGVFTERNGAHSDARAHREKLEAQPMPEIPGDAKADAIEAERLRAAIAAQQGVLDDIARATTAYDAWAQEGERLRQGVRKAERAVSDAEAMAEGETAPLLPLEQTCSAASVALKEAQARTAKARELVVEARPVDCAAEEATLTQAREALAAAEKAVQLAQEGKEQAAQQLAKAQAPVDPALASAATEAALAAATARTARDDLRNRLAAARSRAESMHESGTDAVCVHCGAADPLGNAARAAEAQARADDLAEAADDADAMYQLRSRQSDAANKAEREAAEARQRRIDHAHQVGEDAAAVLAAAETQVNRCRATVTAAERALERAQTAGQREADAVRAKAIAEAQAAESAAADALQSARDALALQRRKNEDAASANLRRHHAIEAATVALNAARAALTAWEQQSAPALVGDPDAVQATMQRLRAELAPIAARQEARTKAARQAELLEQAIKAEETAAARLDEVKALRKALSDVRDAIAAEAFVPLEEAGNRILGGLPFRFYVDGPSGFGAIENGVKVPFWSLGRGRENIIAAAFSFALAAVSKAPYRPVAIDDLETIREAWRTPLLEALVEARRAGIVSNVLCTWQSEIPVSAPAGVTVHDLGTQAVAEAA